MRVFKIFFLALFVISAFVYVGLAQQPGSKYGEPLSGLTSDELGRFNVGKREFERPHLPEEGLGPIFNHVSCGACHAVPTTGGSLPDKRDVLALIGRTDPKTGKHDNMFEFGGFALSRHNPTSFVKIHPEVHMTTNCDEPASNIPPEAEFVAFHFGPSLYGFGLIEAIADDTILAKADPNDKDGDGISGRPNITLNFSTGEQRLGRFSTKAAIVSLIDFTAISYVIDLGITNPIFPNDRKPNGKNSKCDDGVPDPEDDGRVIKALADFLTFLGPPPPKPMNSSALRGRQLFTDLGCAKCHTPVMRTAPNPLAGQSLANRDVPLYSDLLLHDMGTDLADGIELGDSRGNEYRTPPLWGLSEKRFYLHDGRTVDLENAVTFHGGEALNVRNKFLRLTLNSRADVINFLKSL